MHVRMIGIHSLIRAAAERYPTRPAVRDGAGTMSYRDLGAAASAAAATLCTRGIGRGARVALVCGRDGRSVCALYGIMTAGAAVVLLDAAWPEAVLAQRLELCAPELVISPFVIAGAHDVLALDELLAKADGNASDVSAATRSRLSRLHVRHDRDA